MKDILLMVALLCLVGTASATDYYVSTTGDNSSNGLTIGTAWQNISYATQQVSAGDTIYLINGTWYNEEVTFANSGTVGNSITITAYNGTPTMDGQDTTFTDSGYNGFDLNDQDYIEISGIEVHNYYSTITNIGSYTTISNCSLHDTGGTLGEGVYGGVIIQLSTGNVSNNTIENCTIYNAGWNTIQVIGNHQVPVGNGIPATHLTIINNEIYNSNKHAYIDLFGNLDYVTIEGNEFYDGAKPGIYTHDGASMNYITIHNNTFTDIAGVCIDIVQNVELNHSIISNNTFTNVYGTDIYPLYIEKSYNMTIEYNYFYNSTAPRYNSGIQNIILNRNYIHSDSTKPMFAYDVIGAIIRNPLGLKTFSVYDNQNVVTLEWDDNSIFTATANMDYSTFVPVRYYSTVSNCSINQSAGQFGGSLDPVTSYNITFTPNAGYGKDVVVNTDLVDDVSNISGNVSGACTVTMTFKVDNGSNTYNLYVDDVWNTTEVSNSDAVVSFDYVFSSSTLTDFEVTWNSTVGWSYNEQGIYQGKRFTVDDNGNYTQQETPTQEDTNLTGLIGVNVG